MIVTTGRLQYHMALSEKVRLDRALVERGLAETREKAQAPILAGLVLVKGKKADKAGMAVAPEMEIAVSGPASRFVGRGGEKLDPALKELDWDVQGSVALDIGSSTGGFVDCLLQ